MAKGYLFIKVDEADAEKFAHEIQKNLTSPWQRALDWEARLKGQSVDKAAEWYIYQNDSAGVCITRNDAETLKVTNIVPVVSDSLSDSDYNAIQQAFQRIVQKTGFPSYITGEEAKLILTAKAQESLERFSSRANKSTGSSHPQDLERWCDFLVTAHEEKCYPDSGALAQYLEEKLGWAADKAHELAAESEFAEVLVKRATKRR
jgi:hypothetical protein